MILLSQLNHIIVLDVPQHFPIGLFDSEQQLVEGGYVCEGHHRGLVRFPAPDRVLGGLGVQLVGSVLKRTAQLVVATRRV